MPATIEQWDIFEQTFVHVNSDNPFRDVTLEATFTCQDHSIQVEGFYDGSDVFKIRCMPNLPGEWSFVTRSNVLALNGQKGNFTCGPAHPHNHGPVRVVENVHFAYEDGTPYYPVGTTCYVWNLQGDEMESRTLRTLEQAPFNKMRMCVFPKRYRFNNNEPPCYPFPGQVTSPWNPTNLDNLKAVPGQNFWDFDRFNPEYFRRLENRIRDLRERGIEADLILFHPYDFGAWGFDRLPAETRIRLLKYLVARLSAFRNLWWSFANEYDLMLERTIDDWDQDMQLVQALDPYNHLRSIHNCGKFYNHRKPWVTHCSIQHHRLDQVPTWIRKYGKPIVVDECGYEGDIYMQWGDLSAEEMVVRFWLGFASGGYVGHGETYMNDQDLLWWSKGGELHGQSPARIAFLRKIFEEGPGSGLYPLKKGDFSELDSLGELFSPPDEAAQILPEGPWNIEAGAYRGTDYFLFYFGMHQPRQKNFNLPEGQFQVDIIDTWNMTIEPFAERAAGKICVDLPARKFIAIRIQRMP